MRATIKKWGNSAAVRIPVALLEAARIKVDCEVELRGEDGRIVIDPVQGDRYKLDQLVDGISPGNLHGEIDSGPAIGRELL